VTPDTDLHACELRGLSNDYGEVIIDVTATRERPDGTLWASTGEYESQVNYCPVCGYRARIAVVPTTS